MLDIILLSMIIILTIGLITKFILDFYKVKDVYGKTYTISWFEFIIIFFIFIIIIVPFVTKFGYEIAKKNKMKYYEYWNGWETSVEINKTCCTRNGSCKWEYDCDYHVDTYSCNCGKNGCKTCTRVDHEHCPYVDTEYKYIINTTIGSFVIDSGRFPENPQNHRWREREKIPQNIIDRAGVGEPEFWSLARKRIDNGKPGWATKTSVYNNYIFASEDKLLNQFSDKIDLYKNNRLLPPIPSSIKDFYHSDKVSFVKVSNIDTNLWNDRLGYLNSAFGEELQGDIKIVIVNDKLISNPDEYVISLRAYWQQTKIFGKYSLPKNSLVIIFGTDGKNITWSKAFTGMPLGNEELIVAISSLKGSELDPIKILGNVERKIDKDKVITVHSMGLLENLINGFSDKSTKFKRISMSSKDKFDNGTGFKYLIKEINPSKKQKVFIIIICVFLSIICWFVVSVADFDSLLKKQKKKGFMKHDY